MISKPSQVTPAPKGQAGGDDSVERDSKGRPRIMGDCDRCDASGRQPSEKRAGATVQCAPCKGTGKVVRSFTRVTTFIDVLDDKSNLMAWGKRMVLIGAAMEPHLVDGVLDRNPDVREDKDWLNRKAESAATVAGASKKAERGTHLHSLSEIVDSDELLPDGVSFEDVVDMDAYRRATANFKIVHMEHLVVLDDLKVAGTPDRVSSWIGDYDLVAPDGVTIGGDELLITDLKTGSVEYGALKMAMQLSIYSRGKLYDSTTGTRTPMERVNQAWGVIMHVPAGSGEATLYWADLSMGWEAVGVAKHVRTLRTGGKGALVPFGAGVKVSQPREGNSG